MGMRLPSTVSRLMIVAGLLAATSIARAAEAEEAQYNVVARLSNAGQWQAALEKIAEREKQQLAPAMRARYAFARGLALEATKKPADARRAFTEVFEKHPSAPEAIRARAAVVFLDHAAGDLAAALAGCAAIDGKALPVEERRQLALVRADAALAAGDPGQALAACEEARSLKADPAVVTPKLFGIYQALGKHADLVKLAAEPVPGVPDDARRLARSEAFLALGKPADAEAEAKAVPPKSPYAARAKFALARALARQDKLVEAADPLAEAIRDLRDPPAPPSAGILLAECLLAAGRQPEAERALAEAVARAGTLQPADREALVRQAALLKIRVAAASKDAKAVAAAVDAARDALPPEQRAKAVYARLFALHESRDDAALLRSMDADLAAVRDAPEEGAAVLLLAAALERRQRADDARRLLDSFVERRPDVAEAAQARLALADAALQRGDFAAARTLLDGFLATRDVTTRFGKEAVAQASYNLAVAALRLDDPRAVVPAVERVRQISPGTPLLARALVLLGQARAATQDWPAAAAAWNEALANGQGIDEADVRSRLARALVAAGKPADARTQFERLATTAGGIEKLSRDDREALARALFATGDFVAAAAAYDALARGPGGTARQAFEAGVCSERADRWADADKAYTLAERRRDELPAEYAAALPEALARVRLRAGTGDRGMAQWLGRLEPATPDEGFDAALATVATIAGGTAAGAVPLDRLEKLLDAYGPRTPRAFGIGAVLLQAAAVTDQPRMKRLAPRLAADYAAAAAALPADTWSTTVAPAIIHFYAGEALRAAGDHAAALAAYETVLAAYPVNEWPDAAAYGAAECYAALGDTATALARLGEVAAEAAADRPDSKWIETARRRLAELSSTQPRGE